MVSPYRDNNDGDYINYNNPYFIFLHCGYILNSVFLIVTCLLACFLFTLFNIPHFVQCVSRIFPRTETDAGLYLQQWGTNLQEVSQHLDFHKMKFYINNYIIRRCNVHIRKRKNNLYRAVLSCSQMHYSFYISCAKNRFPINFDLCIYEPKSSKSKFCVVSLNSR